MNNENDKRFRKAYEIDGHPIQDTKSGVIYHDAIKSQLIDLLNSYEEQLSLMPTIERGKNRYGVDMSYFSNAINRDLNRGLRDYTPDELARVFARLSRAADPSVMHEDEFKS